MNLFDLFIKLDLKDEASAGLDKAEKNTDNFSKKVGAKLKTASKVGATALAALATAAIAATTAFVKAANDVAAYGDNIDKMSQKMGLSAETFQEWDFIMQHAGTSMETMKASMKTLATAAESGNKAFSKLGITQEELANLNQEEIFERTIAALQGVENTTERTYLAGQLLGRGATELGAVLNMTAEETEAAKQKIHELGGVMSEEAVKASVTFQDSILDLKTAFEGLKRGAAQNFIPTLNQITQGLTGVLTGSADGTRLFSEGVSDLLTNIIDGLPQAADTLLDIVGNLLDSLDGNEIGNALVDFAFVAIDGIIDALPKFLKLGKDIIFAIVDGIASRADELVLMATEIILTIAEAVYDPKNIVLLVKSGVKIVSGLISGIIKATPKIVSQSGELMFAFAKGIINSLPGLANAVAEAIGDFFLSLIGIGTNRFEEAGVKAGASYANGFKNGVSGVEPSGVSQKLGAAGVEAGVSYAQDFKNGILGIGSGDVAKKLGAGVGIQVAPTKESKTNALAESSNNKTASVSNNTTNITINAQTNETPEELAYKIDKELKRLEERRSSVYGIRYKKPLY